MKKQLKYFIQLFVIITLVKPFHIHAIVVQFNDHYKNLKKKFFSKVYILQNNKFF